MSARRKIPSKRMIKNVSSIDIPKEIMVLDDYSKYFIIREIKEKRLPWFNRVDI